SGYELFWKNTNGQFARWVLDANGSLASSATLSIGDLNLSELRLRADLNGDRKIGPLAEQAGTPNNDNITGQPFTVSYGFAGNDTLTSGGRSSSNSFDVLIGGAGNDSYIAPIGSICAIGDLGGGTDTLSALGLSIDRGTTSVNTLENGRDLIASDSSTGTTVVVMGWQNPANQIESITLADAFGNAKLYTFADIQSIVQQGITQGTITDTTWSQSLSTSPDISVLTSTGLANTIGINAMIASYSNVNSVGHL
ncbi:MAG: hypothetical protein WCF98_11035, partial [Synechococcus sp. ELA057]